ncbi:DUF1376 domain-containing protein [Sphingobacterium mizutaii]|uniref:DUF1376 domain-containing protein n=1 Tax=Sphingobacterium mizutaii TaxID=1010 RepID=UPI0028A1FCB0|nr:DUF1376 domain-containing protein [Sphingobacterium mizutaii]
MAKSPAFQFYASDFLTDTQSWDVNEVGIYIRLLSNQWVNGSLPGDLIRLSRIAGCEHEMFKKAWVILGLKFLKNNDGSLYNRKLESVREASDRFKEKQALNGSKGGRPPKNKNPEETQIKPKQNPEHNPNKSSSSSSSNRYINISFDDFWNEYDKKVGDKSKIQRKWENLKDEDRTKTMEHLPKYKMAQPNKKFRKDPETYLNNKSWNDEIISDDDVADVKQLKFAELDASNF